MAGSPRQTLDPDRGTLDLKTPRLDRTFFVLLFLVGLATFVAHECAHWLVGVSLGYDMVMTPNRVWSTTDMTAGDDMLMSSAGPAITIAQGIIGFVLVRTRSSLTGFAMLYLAFFSRVLAGAVSFANPNDEARISHDLALGTWTLPAIIIAGLFALLYFASRRLGLTVRDQFFCYVVASVAVTLMVGMDYFFYPGA